MFGMKKRVYGADIVNNNIKIGSIVKCRDWLHQSLDDVNTLGVVIEVQKHNKKSTFVHVHLSNSENRIYNQVDIFSLIF